MELRPNDPAEVFERYRRQLRAFNSRRVDSVSDVEDIHQEVFLRFVQTDAATPIGQVAAWLFRAARNRIIDRSRKRRETAYPVCEQDDETGLVSEVTALLADDRDTPEIRYMRALVWEELEKALDELPEPQREVFYLTEIEGFSFRELAEDTGIPVATLLSRKHYAVRYLRARLADIYEALLTE